MAWATWARSRTATLDLALTCCVTSGELLAFSDPEPSALYEIPEPGDSRLVSLGVCLTFGAGPPAGLGGRAAAGGRRTIPKGAAAQGRGEQIQGARVQAEGLEFLCQEAEALCLAAALLLKLSNPDLSQGPP